MTKLFLLPLIALTMSVSAWSQEALFFGNDAMEAGLYAKAINHYQVAFAKKRTFEAASKMAFCMEKVHRYDDAEEWYRNAVELKDANDSLLPYYANILKMNGKYEDAKLIYQSIMVEPKEGNDSIVPMDYSVQIKSCDDAMEKMALETTNEIIRMENVNSKMTEFPSVFINQQLFFASNRTDSNPNYKKINGENGYPYYTVFGAEIFGLKSKENFKIEDGSEFPYHQGPIFITKDNKAYLTVDKSPLKRQGGQLALDIFVGTYEPSSRTIKDLKPFEHNTEEFSEGHVFVTADGNELYFVSNRPQSLGGTDIFVCKKNGNGWTAPMNLGNEVNSEYDELYPVMRNSDELYFSSTRPEGLGGMDIYTAKRRGSGWESSFGLNPPFNTSRDDFAMTFGKDSQNGYLASNRKDGVGLDDIYGFVMNEGPHDKKEEPVLAENTAKEEPKYPKDAQRYLKIEDLKLRESATDSSFYLSGRVKKYIDTILLPFDTTVTVTMLDPYGNKMSTQTDDNGFFYFERVMDGAYKIRASKDGFFTNSVDVQLDAPNSVAVIDENDLLENIQYDFNSAVIKAESYPQLDAIVAIMKAKPEYNVFLKSYTDSRGSDAYNLALSKRRATSVKNYLIQHGIAAGRITSNGYGETNLIVLKAETEEQHQLNRRTEFKWIVKQ